MKRFIFIPVVNNFHLLQKAINSVPPNLYDEYFIFNNSDRPLPSYVDIKHFEVVNNKRKTFLQTQNIMRQYAIINNYDWYSFMHNDGEIIGDAAYRMVSAADKLINENVKWSIIFSHYDVYCCYNTECVKEIGPWGDENWPKEQQSGYCLDVDYYNRMSLSNYKRYQLLNSTVLHNEPSNTINDSKENKLWKDIASKVHDYYDNKWNNIAINNSSIGIN